MKSISLYVNNGAWLTRVHPLTKLLYTLAAIVIPIILGQLWFFLVTIALSAILLTANGILRKAIPLLVFSFTIILVVFLIQGLFYYGNETPLLTLGPAVFYHEGVLYAARIGGNILNMLLAFAVFILSTDPVDLVEELEQRGMSPKVGYVLNSVFQIIPQMLGTSDTITDAQRSRGMETEGSLATRAKAFIPLISPVVMSSLINTKERALALEVRGFGSKTRKTYIRTWQRHKGDRAIGILMVALIAAAIAVRIIIL